MTSHSWRDAKSILSQGFCITLIAQIISYLSKKKKRSNFGQFSCTLFKSNVFDAINLSRNTKAVLQSVVYLLSYSRLKVENEKCKQFPLANKMYSISETAADIQPAQPYTCCSNQVQMTVQLFLLHILQALAIWPNNQISLLNHFWKWIVKNENCWSTCKKFITVVIFQCMFSWEQHR